MDQYEYRVIPAPDRGVKAKGVKTPEARFGLAVERLLNEMAAEGWEYQRAETLPSVERSGLTSSTTQWRNILVFRRPRGDAIAPLVKVVENPDEARTVAGRKEPSLSAPSPAADPDAAPPDAAQKENGTAGKAESEARAPNPTEAQDVTENPDKRDT